MLLARTREFLACTSLPFELTLLRYEDFVADPVGQTEVLAEVLGADVGLAPIKDIVADTTPMSMREREIKGKKESPTLNFIGPAKASNWKQLQSEDDAVSILEEFARDAMRFGGYLCEGVETHRELASLSEQFGDAWTKSSLQFV